VLLCVSKVATGLVCAGVWAVGSILQLAVGLVRATACAIWAVVKGVVSVVAWPFMCVGKLAVFLVRAAFRTLVWTVCTILKAPMCLILALYCAIACVVRGLRRGPVALKRAVCGPRGSSCAAVVEFDASLAELSVAEICGLINPFRCPNQEGW
jgi:hypothetical protein